MTNLRFWRANCSTIAADLQAAAVQSSANVVITAADHDTLTLKNMTLSTLAGCRTTSRSTRRDPAEGEAAIGRGVES
jgi:hypothetical protein